LKRLVCAICVFLMLSAAANAGVGSFVGSAVIFSQSWVTQVEIVGSWTSGLTHAEEAGSNRALIFFIHAEHNAVIDINSVTYGGQPMTLAVKHNAGTSSAQAYVAAYILDESGIAAATGDTFVPVWTTTPLEYSYASVFLSNVNQAAPVGVTDSNGTASATPNPIATNPLSTNFGDMVIAVATAGFSGDYTLNNGFSEGYENDMATSVGAAGYKSATGADETPSVTHTGDYLNRQVIIGFVVQVAELTHTLTTSSTAGGSVDTPGEGDFDYDHGTEVNLVALPDANYHFFRWTGTAADAGKITDIYSQGSSVLMDADYTAIANFAVDGTWNVIATAGANGSVDPNGVITVAEGNDLMFDAEPNVGYVVDTWYLDGNSVQTGGDTYTLYSIAANHTVHVTFESLQFTISGTITCGSLDMNDVNMVGLGVLTDANGFYTATVGYGWTGVVTPVKYSYTFDPSSISYSNVTADHTNQDYDALPADDFNDNRRSAMWRLIID